MLADGEITPIRLRGKLVRFHLAVRRVEIAKAFALFLGGFALHADGDAAVGEGVGQAANGGDRFGAP